MKFLTGILFMCWAMLLVSGDGVTNVSINPEPRPSPPNTTTSTTTTPATTTTTSTTTTTKPTTTTTKPTTTTPPTTTTTTQKTTTTTSKTTTTPATTTTSAPPIPVPDPKPGKWVVDNKTETCIIVRMAVQFNISYMTIDNKTVHEMVTLPENNSTAISSGICGDVEQVMYIKWKAIGSELNNSVVFHFVKNGTDSYSLHHIEAYILPQQLPKINTNGTLMMIHNSSEYKTALSNSYRCMRTQNIEMKTNLTNSTGSMKVSDLQFQAFKKEKSPSFGYAEDCAFETQDVVPIAVGCALIALVVIVLVAYLVGRRRSEARGYVSM